MSITGILKDSVRIAKENPLIFVPMLAASVFGVVLSLIVVGSTVPMVAGFAADPDSFTTGQAIAHAGSVIGAGFIVGLISGIVGLAAHGMTVAMADLALKGEKPTLGQGFARFMERLVPILIAAILVGLLVGFASLLLVLPGIIVGFLLMFTLVSVMVDDATAFDALGRSFRTVIRNFKATFVFFLVLIALGILAGIIGAIVGIIPILGAILTMVVTAAYTGFITIYMLCTYRALGSAGEAPEAEV